MEREREKKNEREVGLRQSMAWVWGGWRCGSEADQRLGRPEWEIGVERVRDRSERVRDRSERVSLREMFRDEMRVREREREREREKQVCIILITGLLK